MNRKINSCVLVALVMTAGCKKFLEQAPDNRATIETPAQLGQLLTTAYPDASYVRFTEAASDNLVDKGAGLLNNYYPYTYQDDPTEEKDSPAYYWYAAYKAIAAANQAIAICDQSTQPQKMAAYRGEALLARAYAHFMLVSLFAHVYDDPASAATQPGIPYIKQPQTTVTYQRNRGTVAEVYQDIEADIEQGIPLLNDNNYSVPQYHFTRSAAHAFATRFYLFKKDYSKVIDHASLAFTGSIKAFIRPWNTTYTSITWEQLIYRYQAATEKSNFLLGLANTDYAYNFAFATYRYGMNGELKDTLFNSVAQKNPAAIRRNVVTPNGISGGWAFMSHMYTLGSVENLLLPKQNANARNVAIPLITAEEVLFNLAEAQANIGKTNEAITHLNDWLSTRVLFYDPAQNSLTPQKLMSYYNTNLKTAIIQAILDCKQKEFVQEGMRWFDILRHHIPVTHKVITTSGGSTSIGSISLANDDPRRLFQLPASVQQDGIALNPR